MLGPPEEGGGGGGPRSARRRGGRARSARKGEREMESEGGSDPGGEEDGRVDRIGCLPSDVSAISMSPLLILSPIKKKPLAVPSPTREPVASGSPSARCRRPSGLSPARRSSLPAVSAAAPPPIRPWTLRAYAVRIVCPPSRPPLRDSVRVYVVPAGRPPRQPPFSPAVPPALHSRRRLSRTKVHLLELPSDPPQSLPDKISGDVSVPTRGPPAASYLGRSDRGSDSVALDSVASASAGPPPQSGETTAPCSSSPSV
ncbi:hypothetical protein PVAP13_8NG031202 [Panicum virgatum]|uniref:Uncharacterized protein n=1 Tax=Panicum virgatum TaxID=38727 RepID=A0A8T0PAW3_PANVG|nr:hypothetical protein PVAP13_8NG031202 [Panicum virgatum]